jgi:xanthine/CO dehydrogenase XdhC/CoxF family maturation factor
MPNPIAGARMLALPGGRTVGSISGGCLARNVAHVVALDVDSAAHHDRLARLSIEAADGT